MSLKQTNWTRILTILLVILASFAILYIVGSILFRFTNVILLFVLGAIAAYVLGPIVKSLQTVLRVRWLSVLMAYLMVATALFVLGVLLITPFVNQAQSLVDNLHNPEAGSLKTVGRIQSDMNRLHGDLVNWELAAAPALSSGNPSDINHWQGLTQKDVATLTTMDMTGLRNGTLVASSRVAAACRPGRGSRISSCPQPQTQVPPSYVNRVQGQVSNLGLAVQHLMQEGTESAVRSGDINRVSSQAKQASQTVGVIEHTLSTTPILLLRSQTFLDQHNIHYDLLSKAGDATHQLSNQSTNILDNAITIVSTTTQLLLDTILILIIAFYLLNDGPRLIRRGVQLIPGERRNQVTYFVQSLDRVMGGYVRGQLFLSTLAGVLGGGAAAVLGVPYPLLIGIMTFLLQTIPVIGPMIAVLPAVIISLFFVSFTKTVILFVWFLVFQQVVTNVLGPKVMGSAVGIHPLEALLAVLVGYPLGGLLGAFLAVPVMGLLHIVIHEAYNYFALGKSISTAPASVEQPKFEVSPNPPSRPPRPETDSAPSQS
jgi:predicted PurR-regulated permease PerM